MISVVLINQIDDNLQDTADEIIEMLRADENGSNIVIDELPLIFVDENFFQVWSEDKQLLAQSENAGEFSAAFDVDALDTHKALFNNTKISQTQFRVLTIPLKVNEQNSGWLQTARPLTNLRQTQQLLQVVFGASAVFICLVAGIVGWLVIGQALEPLHTMAEITKRIASTDDLSQRIPVTAGRNDETTELILTFNQTLVRLERLFNTQRRFLADVSHELRTPLTAIKGNIGLMRLMRTFDEESLQSIESETDRLTRLVGDLLLMAQAETGKLPLVMQQVEIGDLIFEVFEQMKILSNGMHNIQIGNIESAIVTGDRDRLKQVFINLCSNAIKFSPEGALIIISLSIEQGWVKVSVKDEGSGIPKEELDWLFERFYRGDKSRSRTEKDIGFGLGLPIAYWIVINHGGRIDVATEVDEGTTFTVSLPLSQRDIPTRPLRP